MCLFSGIMLICYQPKAISMSEPDPHCPDCDIEMEEMTLRSTDGHILQFVSGENRDGILGSLGVKQKFGATTFVCPECGVSRLYAELDG